MISKKAIPGAVDQNNAAPTSDYSVVTADLVADRASIMELWRDNPLQPAGVDEKFEWFYLDNPGGISSQFLLRHGPQAECVGTTGLVKRRFLARGIELLAGQLTDFFVRPEHRTLFPAMLLQKQVRSTGLAALDFLYGYPNDKARAILGRVGYARIGDFSKFIALLRYGEYLERWLPHWLSHVAAALIDRILPLHFRPNRQLLKPWHSEWLDAPDARFDVLWERAKQFDGLIGVRDQPFLSWRFFARPDHQYRLFALSHELGGPLAAYAVCEAQEDTLHIRDMLVDAQSMQDLRVLIHLLSRQAYGQGFKKLSFEFFGNAHLRHIIHSAGLFERGKTPLVASFGSLVQAAVDGLDWYLTSADTEL